MCHRFAKLPGSPSSASLPLAFLSPFFTRLLCSSLMAWTTSPSQSHSLPKHCAVSKKELYTRHEKDTICDTFSNTANLEMYILNSQLLLSKFKVQCIVCVL